MMYVSCMGSIWRLSKPAYAAMLMAIVDGGPDEARDLNRIGKRLGDVENVDYLTSEEAKYLLEQLRQFNSCRRQTARLKAFQRKAGGR